MAFDIELSEDGRRYVVLMVAAFGVGGIASSYLPEHAGGRRTGLADVVSRGDEIGTFRIGSTVVLLWPKGAVELGFRINVDERVLVGQEMGRVCRVKSKKS
jgi:phosphatidylserine decarboxylase